MSFNQWLDTFIEEKGIDINETFIIEKGNHVHYFDYDFIITTMKQTSDQEQQAIKDMLVKIDFQNGDVKDYLRHLAQAFC